MTRGQSTAVATVFMVAVLFVVGGSVAYAGSEVVSDAQRDPVSAALTTAVDGENVTVTHDSGDRLAAADVDLVIRSTGGTTRLPLDAATQRGNGDGTLTAGETFTVGHGLSGESVTVRVVHRPSESVLARDEFEIPVLGTVPDPTAKSESYSTESNQDEDGSLTVTDGTYRLEGNTWKQVGFNYTVTSATVLVFEFKSHNQGAIHAIGLGTDNKGDQPLYALYGSQDVTVDPGNYNFNHTYETYTDGDGWVRYEIPVGEAFHGDVTELVFVNDLDGNDDDLGPPGVVSEFRNIRVEER